MRSGLRSQGDAKCSDEPRDRGTDGDTARPVRQARHRHGRCSSGRLVSVRAEYEL